MEDIAKQAVTRYSEGGIVSLSFGLLLLALLWDAWQSRKQAAKDREVYQAHVLKFAEVTAENTAVVRRATETLEDMTTEVRSLAGNVDKLSERVGRIDGRAA